LELRHARRALAMRGANTIRTRVTTADDDDMLARSEKFFVRTAPCGVRYFFVLRDEKIHRELNALEIAPGYGQVTRPARSEAEDDRVERLHELARTDVSTDRDAREKRHSLGAHLCEARLEDGLLELEVRDSVSKKPSDAGVPLEHGHVVSFARE